MDKEIEKIATNLYWQDHPQQDWSMEVQTTREWYGMIAKKVFKAGYRLPATDEEEKLAQAFEPDGVRTPSSDLFRELADPEYRYCFIKADRKTQGDLYHLQKPSTANREAVEKLFENGLSCSDGCTHFLDESQKRYSVGQILALFPKPDQEHDEAMFRKGFEFAQTTDTKPELLSDGEIEDIGRLHFPMTGVGTGLIHFAKGVAQAQLDKEENDRKTYRV